MSDSSRIAIVGMSARFPGAPDLEAYWQLLAAGRDAIREPPPDRLPPVFFEQGSTAIDRFSIRRGGFLDEPISLDIAALGLMPVAARGAEPDQLLTLEAASLAMADANLLEADFDRSRVAVILGRGGYLGPGLVRADQSVRGATQLVELLRRALPGLSEANLASLKLRVQKEAGPYGPDTAIGLVPNLAASRIANRLDLGGPAFTLDAACASSLIAVEQGLMLLRTGKVDRVIAGGVHLVQDPTFWSIFQSLGALSRGGTIHPFDRRADGLLIGEGVGIVVLEREVEAMERGARCYARLLGAGSASDGRGSSLMQPRASGQELAILRAWVDAGLDPIADGVGLIEGHGTGTRAGDSVELETLARSFGAPEGSSADAQAGAPRPVLGSVKSMIGHAMPAAGAAGLIKATLALHHDRLLPSLHCEEPHPGLALTQFRVLGGGDPEASPEAFGALPLRAGVNAFGFGGIDAHLVLEGCPAAPAPLGPPPDLRAQRPALPPVIRIAASDPEALLHALDAGAFGGEGPCRLVLPDDNPRTLARARRIIERGEAWRGRGGVYYCNAEQGLARAGGKLVFLFPGIDADFRPQLEQLGALAGHPLPAALQAFSTAAPKQSRQDEDAKSTEDAETEVHALEKTGLAIYELGGFLCELLERYGVHADAMAGHSIGEWGAMVRAGLLPTRAVNTLLGGLELGSLERPDVLFAAAGCGLEQAQAAIEGLPKIAVSHDNCPHQVILCGLEQSIETACARLKASGLIAAILPFKSGFHSPLFADYLAPHRARFEALPFDPPKVPIWSATACAPFPASAAESRALASRHLVEPVRFRELIEALYASGHSLFVQVGTGSLVGFVNDTLGARPHLVMSANLAKESAPKQLATLLAALWVEGLEGLQTQPHRGGADQEGSSSTRLRISLAAPFVQPPVEGLFDDALLGPSALPPPDLKLGGAPGPDPIREEVEATLAHLAAMQTEVVQSYALSRRGKPHAFKETRNVSVGTEPFLLDHSFYPQGEGASLAECDPVVPMTMSVELLLEAAEQSFPGRRAVTLRQLEMLQWLRVQPPVEVERYAHPTGPTSAEVGLRSYCKGIVDLQEGYPPAPPRSHLPLKDPRPSPVDAATLYLDRWMFHGPAYQGVTKIAAVGSEGVDGELVVTQGQGALLDSAGQLFGFFLMATEERDRLAMPIGIDRLERFGPHPPLGARLRCTVRIDTLNERRLVGSLEIGDDQGLFCRITGWTDHRFPSDPHTWAVLQHPERASLCVPLEGLSQSLRAFDANKIVAPSRDWLMRRMLSERERHTLLASPPQAQRAFLHLRIAAKEAARAALWNESKDKASLSEIFPAQLGFESDDAGRLRVVGAYADQVFVDAVALGNQAFALASMKGPVGIAAFNRDALPPLLRTATHLTLEGTPAQAHSGGRGRTKDAGSTAKQGSSLQALRHYAATLALKRADEALASDPEKMLISEVSNGSFKIGARLIETTLCADEQTLIAWTLP